MLARGVAGRFRRFVGGCGPRAATTLAVLVLAGVAVPARAEFPGEVFDVHDVDVASAAPGDQSGAVLMGLRQANEVYFYGDRPAKMRATVRAEGVVDVQVIDVMTGSILLERQGLSFPTDGEVSQAVAGAALEWMQGLECAGACAPGDGAPALASAEARHVVSPAAPAIPAAEAAPVTGGAETAMQEVVPGVRLPAPRAGVASMLARLLRAGGEAPRVGTSAGDGETLALAPVGPGVASAPAARAAEPVTGGEGPSPAPAAETAADTAADSSVLAPSRTTAPAPNPVTEGTAAVEPAAEPGERLALAPATGPAPQRAADAPAADARDSEAAGESELVLPADALQPAEPGSGTLVETRVASVDATAEGPTLANARWVGFTPAVFTGSDTRPGAWISGPFDREERTGWITDTATGATTRVTFLWREGGRGSRTATLSQNAARALGLGQGDVANVAVYLPR